MQNPKVIDADGHIYENHEEIEEYFEGKYRVGRGRIHSSLRWMAGRVAWAPGVPIRLPRPDRKT